MKKTKPRKPSVNLKNQEALEFIANMGKGISATQIDWASIGKNAVHVARNTLAGTCEACGTQKQWESKP